MIDFTLVHAHLKKLKAKQDNSSLQESVEQSNTFDYQNSKNSMAYSSNTGLVPLTNVMEEVWHGPITLGGQEMPINFDTGSSDLILNKSAYKPSKDAIDTGENFTIKYGDGTAAEGKIYLDSIDVGGIKTESVAIGLANEDIFDVRQGVGVAGLAFRGRAHLKKDPFFDTLLKAKVLNEPVFAFDLRSKDPVLQIGSTPTLYEKPIFIDVDQSRGLWNVQGSINGIPTQRATIDTGTTLIVTPTGYAENLFNSLGFEKFKEKGETYAIYNQSKPPKITVQFDSFTQPLSDETLLYGTTEKGDSILSIIGSDAHEVSVTFGCSFLRNVIAIFSRKEKVSSSYRGD